MWGMAGVTLGVYNITQDLNIPLIAQPELFSFLSLVSWGQVSHPELPPQSIAATFLHPVSVLWQTPKSNESPPHDYRRHVIFRWTPSRNRIRHSTRRTSRKQQTRPILWDPIRNPDLARTLSTILGDIQT